MRTIELEARCLSALALGPVDGPLVLMQHGFPDVPRTFAPQMQALAARGFRCVAPWLRGYAPSTRVGSLHRDAIGDDLVAWADALSPDAPARLVGHDWGAVAAQCAARDRPERWSHLVLMSVPHLGAFVRALRAPDQLRRSAYMGFFQLGPLADAAVLHDPARFVDAIFERWSPGGGASPAHRAEVAACLRTSMPEPVAMYRAQMGRASDVAAEFERLDGPSGHIHVPTLYLHGERDGCIGVDHVHGQAARFPAGHETQIVEGAGHFLTLDAPKAVSRHLEAFLGTA